MTIQEFIRKHPFINMSLLSIQERFEVNEFIRLLGQTSNDLEDWLKVEKFKSEADKKMNLISRLTTLGRLKFGYSVHYLCNVLGKNNPMQTLNICEDFETFCKKEIAKAQDFASVNGGEIWIDKTEYSLFISFLSVKNTTLIDKLFMKVNSF